MRPALATQAADLPVALRLHAAREAAGQDRGLRDADAEGLRHHAQWASLPDHLHEPGLGRGPPASAHAATARRHLGQRQRGRVAQQPAAQARGVEAKGIAHVLEGEGPARVASLDPLPRLRGELTALAPGPDLAYQAVHRVLEDGAHERPLTGGRTRLGHPYVLRLLRHTHIKQSGMSPVAVWRRRGPSLATQ